MSAAVHNTLEWLVTTVGEHMSLQPSDAAGASLVHFTSNPQTSEALTRELTLHMHGLPKWKRMCDTRIILKYLPRNTRLRPSSSLKIYPAC